MFIQVKAHKGAKNYEDGYKRQHGVNALDLSSVGTVPAVGEPGVVGGVVGGGTEECHDAVHDDGEDDGANVGKDENRDAPKHVAYAHEGLAATDFVGNGAHDQSGDSGHDCAGHDHGGNLRGGGVKHFIDEHVEVHVLDNPCNLAHKAKDEHGGPKAFSKIF